MAPLLAFFPKVVGTVIAKDNAMGNQLLELERTIARANNRRIAIALFGLYLLLLLTPLTTAWATQPRTNLPFLAELGKSFALIGFAILALQFVLSSRHPVISQPFGLDLVLRYHKAMGTLAGCLLLLHPFLIAAGTGKWRLIYGVVLPWPVWLGKIALVLLAVQVVTGLGQRQLLAFEKWRTLHNEAVVIFGLVLVHSLNVGDDLKHLPLQVLWGLLALLAAAAYVYHKVYRPAGSRQFAYHIKDVIPESYNVRTLVLEPPAGAAPYFYLPGQFHFLKLYRGDRRYDGEEHHFTISSSPTQQGLLASTIKESGDFTASLGTAKPGDVVHLEGPYGRFSFLLHEQRDLLVFLAGGIGITPIMSMLRFLRDTGSERRAVLLNANKTEKDIIFRQELEEMVKGGHPRLRVVQVLTRPPRTWKGEYGHIDQGMIRRFCGLDIHGMQFYVCGPPGMMDMLDRELRELGVDPEQVHSERFWL
ncbi:MAG: ferredoxin reductase family protein [Desulfobacteraceae bacterium]|nr:ferredoxin reductase family protein [Desulfobacteraceae bacterium]